MSPFARQDLELTETIAMPSAAGDVYTAGIDLGALTTRGDRLADFEMELTRPALGTTPIPDTKTVTYLLETATTSTFGSTTTVSITVVETGSSGAGVAGGKTRMKIPSNCERWIRAKATTGAGTADCSASDMTLKLLT